MSDFKNRLKRMQKTWSEGKEPEESIPDGLYTCQLQKTEIQESMSSQRLQILREHLVLEGEFEGMVVRDYLQLETDLGPRFIAQWLEKMGYEVPEDAGELESLITTLNDESPLYTAQIKTSGEFTNVRVRQILESEDSPDPDPNPDPDPDPDPDSDSASEIQEGTEVTFQDEDGNEIKGTVTSTDGKDVMVEDDEGNVWEVSVDELSGEESAVDDDDDEEDLEAGLLAFCTSYELKDVLEGWDEKSIDDVIEELKGYDFEDLSSEDTEILQGAGVIE